MLWILACAEPDDDGSTSAPPHAAAGGWSEALPIPDADGDGWIEDDCDDADATVHPGADEHCDGRDEDCDGEVDEDPVDPGSFYLDADGDGVGAEAYPACEGEVAVGGDCDDADPTVSPEAVETCDGRDEDCDGEVDEDAVDVAIFFTDADGDGHGGEPYAGCEGGVESGGDCDDADAAVFPGAVETCDGRDEDCDDEADEDAVDRRARFEDLDGDGIGAAAILVCEGGVESGGDCDDADAAVFPGAEERCDGADEDCDGEVDEDPVDLATFYLDADGDGVGGEAYRACEGEVEIGGDCDDADGAVFPGAGERCDGVDEDCDGEVDEDAVDPSVFYEDADGDGFGGEAYAACEGEVQVGGDCDDAAGDVFPGAVESCDGLDQDCDGEVDEDAVDPSVFYVDADGDGFGAEAFTACEGEVAVGGDCDDGDRNVAPDAPERCDGVDDDCDGLVDEDDAIDAPAWYLDRDGDGFGDLETRSLACTQPEGWVADDADCDDDRAESRPGAPELADGHDNDCDGSTAGPCLPEADPVSLLLGDELELQVSCAGVDEGQAMSAEGVPAGASWDPVTRTLRWEPETADIGHHELLVSDDDEWVKVEIDVEDSDQVVFDPEVVHRVDITLSSAAVAALNADATDWQEGGFSFDGEAFTQVGVRATGRLGSARDFPAKVAMKVDLNKWGVDQELHGLQRLDLHNMVQDCAKVKELAAYGAHRLLGLPAPRVVYAQVFVNGSDYGLYSVVEEYDDEFLEKNFAEPEGNLYDGDYYLYPHSYSYVLVDFISSSQDYFTMDEGVDVGLADVYAVTEAVASGDYDAVAELVDMDAHAAFLAANAWTGQYDSYSYYRNNYRVYFDPGREGRAVFMPWDPDWAFYSGTPLRSFYGVVSSMCYNDSECRAAVQAYADQLSAEIPGGELEAEVEAAIDLIEPYLAADPKLESSLSAVHTCQSDMLTWFERRGTIIDALGF